MSVDLDRALRDETYRESVIGLADPAVELLRRAGAYAWSPEESREVWSPYGEDLGREMVKLRDEIPPDPTLPFESLAPLFASGFGRAVIAVHPSTPLSALLELAGDELEAVQKAVLENKRIDVSVLMRLCRSQFRQVRLNLMHHRLRNQDMVELLLVDGDQLVRSSALKRGNADGPTLARIAEREPELGHLVAAHPNVEPKTLAALAASTDTETLVAVAKNPRAPADALERITHHELTNQLRTLVMLHPNTPQQWVNDQVVARPLNRATLAQRKDLSADAQMICATDADPGVRAVLARHGTDERALTLLSTDREFKVRIALAENPSAPVAVLEALARESEFMAYSARKSLELHRAATGEAKKV